MKLLIVEDEKDLALTLKKGFEENSFAVDVCYDGEEGLFMAENYPYDVLLLDIMLPKMDGLAILNTLRKKKIDIPVVMLTATGEVEDRIKGLNIGADDYIAKPFDFSELLARLRSVVRRSKGKPSPVGGGRKRAFDTGIVESAIEAAISPHRFLHQRGDLRGLRHIALDETRLAAVLPHQLRGLFALGGQDVGHDDFRAFGGENHSRRRGQSPPRRR